MTADPNIKNRPVLIVEDDEDLAALLSERLSSEGYQVRVAKDWEAGRTSLEAGLPDLLIMDLNLPDANGLDVIEALRENEKTKNIPVIITSGEDETANLVRGIKSGVVFFVPKPYDLEKVVGKVRSAIFRRFQMNPGETPPDIVR